jgi:hypothetical protein
MSAVWLLVALACARPAVEAAQPPTGGTRLGFRFGNAKPPMRSDAPFEVTCLFNSTFADVQNGRLEFAFVDDDQVVLRLVGETIAIPSGESSFRLHLPSLHARRNQAAFGVRVVLHSARGDLDLGNHDLLVPLKGRRQFLIGVPTLGLGSVAHLANRLRLDMFRPEEQRRADLVSTPADLDLRDFPTQPIGLYPYDLLLLAEEGFGRLSPRQLEAVVEWIEQGGRAVVVTTGALTPAHKAFLDRITRGEPDPPTFALDQHGHLGRPPSGSKPTLLKCSPGFGRALILSSVPQTTVEGTFRDIDESTWTRAVCFIWNVREAQTQAILKTGFWRPPAPPKYQVDSSLLEPTEFAGAGDLRHMLFPRAVRIVPFAVVVTILALFLLVAAPGDYFLHGVLRRRWVSWIAFPATCFVFTAGTVWIAGLYTGRADHRTALAIVDLGADGSPRRTSRIEHVVTAESRPLSTDVQNGIFAVTDVQPAAPRPASPNSPAPSRTRRFTAPMGFASNTVNDELDRLPGHEVSDYAGMVPLSFSVTRQSRQWTPSMHRVTRPGADVGILTIAWAELDAIDLRSEKGRQALITAVQRAIPDCDVLLQRGAQTSAAKSAQEWTNVLGTLGQRADVGLFSIVSHVSPNGAGDLEDLAIGELSQPDDWLLHLAVRQGDNLIVYRRIMRSKLNVQPETRQ